MSQPSRYNSRKRAKHEDQAVAESQVRSCSRSKYDETTSTVSAEPLTVASQAERRLVDDGSSSSSLPSTRTIRRQDGTSASVKVVDDSDEEEDHTNTNRRRDPSDPSATTAATTTRNMVIYYGREALCLLAILLTTMASYQGGTPKVGRPPTPRQFFPADCPVHDYPAGNLDAVSQQVSLSELSFVLYYAPWDAASQSAREPFADVAHFYQREAHFSAINCWQPGGECRLQYSKIKAWPVLMAYLPKNGLGVLYNGPWERDPMLRFVNSFLAPLKRLNDPGDLLQAMTSHDAILVAFLDLQQDMTEWNVYYETAVKWMYRDPFQDIRFSIVTGESRSKFGVEPGRPVLRMYLWNETIEYDNNTWTSSAIENWSMQTVHRVTLWMSPSGYKSMSLASFFKNGPVLLFFTPRNMLKESTDAVEMLRQIGMEYYNCNKDAWIREMVREYLPQQRVEHQEELQRLKVQCQEFVGARLSSARKSVSSVTFVHLMNGSQLSANERIEDICQLESDSVFSATARRSSMTDGHCVPRAESDREECVETASAKSNKATKVNPLRETSMLRSAFDRRSPENLVKQKLRRRCELMFIDEEQVSQNSFLGQTPFSVAQLQDIEGMGCSGNKSLTMLLMDSSIYHVFAERLGVDVSTAKRQSVVFIVDPENESTHLLNPNEDLTLKSITRFIRKYSEGSLRRHLRSSDMDFFNTHFYAAPIKGAEKKEPKVELVSIEELNSGNFAFKLSLGNHLRTPHRSLLVLFYSSNCGFCTMMSQHLLQIANILRPLSDAGHLKILRIDGDKNDLPWPFTVAEYPTLMFFSGNHEGKNGRAMAADSRQFPISERNSVQLDKILGFTIANLARPLRIFAIELTCAASRRSVKSLANCLASLRAEIQEAISVSLREWRRSREARPRIVRRLQLLEAFYLETHRASEANQCEACDFTKLEGFCKRIVAVWGGEGATTDLGGAGKTARG